MSDLNFDPNEQVVHFGRENHRPINRPQTGAAAPEQAQRPSGATPRPVQTARPQQRMSISEGPPTSRPQIQQPPQTARPQATAPQRAVAVESQRPVEQQQNHVPEPDGGVAVQVATPRSRLPLVSQIGHRNVTAAYEDVWLPSEFVSYPWKDLQVRRFNIDEIRAVVRSRTSGNLRHLIRAVDGTLSRPITDLTVGDFWYLMYWHRLNSYKKSPFTIQWVCDDDDHLKRVGGQDLAEGEEPLAPETLRNLLTVNKSNLKTQSIDKEKYAELHARLLQEYGVHIVPQTLVDFVAATDEDDELEHQRKLAREKRAKAAEAGDVDAFLNDDELSESEQDEDRGFIYRYAALLSPVHGESLQQRAEWLSQQPPDLLIDLEEVLEVADHGVEESWTVTCKECGASKTIQQSLDALTFLPSLQRGGFAES